MSEREQTKSLHKNIPDVDVNEIQKIQDKIQKKFESAKDKEDYRDSLGTATIIDVKESEENEFEFTLLLPINGGETAKMTVSETEKEDAPLYQLLESTGDSKTDLFSAIYTDIPIMYSSRREQWVAFAESPLKYNYPIKKVVYPSILLVSTGLLLLSEIIFNSFVTLLFIYPLAIMTMILIEGYLETEPTEFLIE